MSKKLIFNLNSKGSIGKSQEIETRCAWYDYYGFDWNGIDLDDIHCNFYKRHPGKVNQIQITDSRSAKDAVLSIFDNTLNCEEKIINVDCRAQVHKLLLDAISEIIHIDRIKENDIEITIIIIPFDDDSVLENIAEVVDRTHKFADYVIVFNPYASPGEVFKENNIYKFLRENQSPEITMPVLSSYTCDAYIKAEKENTGLSLLEASRNGELINNILIRSEIEIFLLNMAKQYDKASTLFIDSDNASMFTPKYLDIDASHGYTSGDKKLNLY